MRKAEKPTYVFFGTPEFAAEILERLIAAGLPPACVVCNPDRPVGRKKLLTPPPTKLIAQMHGIEVFQPENLSAEECRRKIGDADLFIVAAYSQIIPKSIIEIPRLGVIGVHPSLLPKHRGASPIQSAILSGDKETGVTLFFVDEKIDHGQTLAIAKLGEEISKLTYIKLQEQLAGLGGDMLAEMVPKIFAGIISPRPQNEAEATYTKKFLARDAFVESSDLDKATLGADPGLAESIDRKMRALNPEPGVWTIKNGKRLKLLEAEIASGKLVLKKIQSEGKKPHEI